MTTLVTQDGVPVLVVPVPREDDRECVAAVLRYLVGKENARGLPPISVEEAVLFAVRCTADTIRGGDAP